MIEWQEQRQEYKIKTKNQDKHKSRNKINTQYLFESIQHSTIDIINLSY